MLSEIYLWLESRSGIPYNLEDEVTDLDSDIVALDSITWMIGIRNIIDLTKEAIDVVSEYADQIPDNLPTVRQIKSMIGDYARNNVRKVMKKAFNTIGINPPDEIMSFNLNTMWNMATAMNDMVSELTTNDIDDVIKSGWFDKYDEDHNNILTETMGIFKQDMSNISYAIQGVREYHEDIDEDNI